MKCSVVQLSVVHCIVVEGRFIVATRCHDNRGRGESLLAESMIWDQESFAIFIYLFLNEMWVFFLA